MTLPDAVTAAFELGGAVAQLANVRRLLRDRAVSGVSLPAAGFFNLWGVWNLFFYAQLDQWLSWGAGVALVAANMTWMSLALLCVKRARKGAVTPK